MQGHGSTKKKKVQRSQLKVRGAFEARAAEAGTGGHSLMKRKRNYVLFSLFLCLPLRNATE